MDENENEIIIENENTEGKENAIPELVNKLKEDYENKIAVMQTNHKAEIAERDEIIRQLISGNQEKSINYSFIDKINNKRNYKKW